MKNTTVLRFLALGMLMFSYIYFHTEVYAEYVLPYPSYMPGNKLYTISRFTDGMKEYWYFGSVAQTKYHMMLADKYLVEAKVLFEYKQYLLAMDALARSNTHVRKIPEYLGRSASQHKDTGVETELFREELVSHMGILENLLASMPSVFEWEPEKQLPTTLPISASLSDAIGIRKSLQ